MTTAKLARSDKLQNILTHAHLCFKLCIVMPEDGRKQSKLVAYVVEYNQFVVFYDDV
jgi:hypothetical protein